MLRAEGKTHGNTAISSRKREPRKGFETTAQELGDVPTSFSVSNSINASCVFHVRGDAVVATMTPCSTKSFVRSSSSGERATLEDASGVRENSSKASSIVRGERKASITARSIGESRGTMPCSPNVRLPDEQRLHACKHVALLVDHQKLI